MTNELPDHSEGAGSAYRVYLLGRSGKVESSVALMAENDEDAVNQTRRIPHDGGVELWDRSRVVFRRQSGSGLGQGA